MWVKGIIDFGCKNTNYIRKTCTNIRKSCNFNDFKHKSAYYFYIKNLATFNLIL